MIFNIGDKVDIALDGRTRQTKVVTDVQPGEKDGEIVYTLEDPTDPDYPCALGYLPLPEAL